MIKTELDKLFRTLRYGIIIFIIMYILKMLFWVSLILGIFYISIIANKVANEFTPIASTSGGNTITLNTTHYKELCENCVFVRDIFNQTECKLKYCY